MPAVVLAVKPQMMAGALPSYRRFATPGTLILSVAAGKTLGYFERGLGGHFAIARSMPNTPAAVGRGITVCCANAHCSAADRDLATALLSAVGEVHWVDDERLIDPVTAVSGGGPAYVFLLIECLAKAGNWGTMLLVLVIAVVIPYEVIGRYLFQRMTVWSGEVSTYALVWDLHARRRGGPEKPRDEEKMPAGGHGGMGGMGGMGM